MLADPALQSVVSDPKAVSKILAYHAAKGARIMPPFEGRNETLPTLLAGQSLTIDKVRRGRGAGCAVRRAAPRRASGARAGTRQRAAAGARRGHQCQRRARSRSPLMRPRLMLDDCQVVRPRAGSLVGTVTVTADSAGAKPAAIRYHNVVAGASLINGGRALEAAGWGGASGPVGGRRADHARAAAVGKLGNAAGRARAAGGWDRNAQQRHALTLGALTPPPPYARAARSDRRRPHPQAVSGAACRIR